MPVVDTASGKVEGRRKGPTVRFTGIPYAAPPTGERRFRPPAPHPGWSGVLDATTFPPASIQSASAWQYRKESLDEDCLYLNVETPSLHRADRPVLVFLHGGAFVSGAGSFAEFRGSRFAESSDTVFVSVNYRLGLLGWGFFEHRFDDLTGSDRCGLYDQLAALRWVYENIDAFGGDPERITVCGQSAGAMSIGAMLRHLGGVPHARAAILQSGTPFHVVPRKVATSVTNFVLANLGVDTIDDLLAAPSQAIVEAQDATIWGPFDDRLTAGSVLRFGPVDTSAPFDPQMLGSPVAATRPLPVIVGSNLDECKAFFSERPPARDDQIRRLTGVVDDPEAVVDHYHASTSSAADAWSAMQSDALYRLPAMAFAEEWGAKGGDAYRYLFAWRPPGSPMGAAHTREIPFAFGSTNVPAGLMVAGPNPPAELEADMHERWSAFVATGAPQRSGALLWPPYRDERATMLFDAPGALVQDPERDLRELWGSG